MTINRVHIGEAILMKVQERGWSKSEFARRLGVLQQHINKIFEKRSIDTDKLAKICEVLDYDFFALYNNKGLNISAVSSAISTGNGAVTNYGNNNDTAIAAENAGLKKEVERLELTIDDKNTIIRLLQERMQNLENGIKSH